MPIDYHVDPWDRIITVTWSGTVTAADLSSHLRRILTDPSALAVRRSLTDLRLASATFTGQELRQVVTQIAIPLLGGKRWVTALVVGSDVQYGIVRQYEVFSESYSHNAVFRTPEEARQWLRLQDP